MARASSTRLPGALGFEKRLREGGRARDFGFLGSDGDVSRFMARFRLAASYRGLRLHGYSKLTRDTYSALLHLFLAWSAFEQYAAVVGLKKARNLNHEAIDTLFARHGFSGERLAGSQQLRQFFAYVAAFVDNKSLNAHISQYVASGEPEPRVLCLALRHAFAHGPLTANAGPRKPRHVTAAARLLAGWLLDVMRSDFSDRIESL